MITSELIKRVADLDALAAACRETGKPEMANYFEQTSLQAIKDVRTANMRHLYQLNPGKAQQLALKAFVQDAGQQLGRIGRAFELFMGQTAKAVQAAHRDQVALQA